MTKDCAYTRRRLPRYLTGHLFGPQRRRVERHLAACAVCSSEHDALRRIDETRAILRDISAPAGMSGPMRQWAARLTKLLYRPLWLAVIVAGAAAFSLYVVRPFFHDPDLERLEASGPLPAAPVPPAPVSAAAPPAAPSAEPPAPVDPLLVTITIDKEQERAALRKVNDAMQEHALLRTMRFTDTVREISGSLTAHELMTLFNRIEGAGKITFRRSRLAKAAEGELLPFVIRIKAVAAPPVEKPVEKPAESPGERPVDNAGARSGAASDRPAERPERSAPSGTAAN